MTHCYHNSVHKLSTSSLQWMMLSPSTVTSESEAAPMRKSDGGVVAFRDGEEDILCVVAGYGPTDPIILSAWSTVRSYW